MRSSELTSLDVISGSRIKRPRLIVLCFGYKNRTDPIFPRGQFDVPLLKNDREEPQDAESESRTFTCCCVSGSDRKLSFSAPAGQRFKPQSKIV